MIFGDLNTNTLTFVVGFMCIMVGVLSYLFFKKYREFSEISEKQKELIHKLVIQNSLQGELLENHSKQSAEVNFCKVDDETCQQEMPMVQEQLVLETIQEEHEDEELVNEAVAEAEAIEEVGDFEIKAEEIEELFSNDKIEREVEDILKEETEVIEEIVKPSPKRKERKNKKKQITIE